MNMVASSCDGVPEFGNAAAHEPALFNGCALGKITTSPFSHTSGSGVKTQIPFELVHSDVMVPIKPVSKGGAKYIVAFIDDYTRMVCVYPIKVKSEVFDRFKAFLAMVETQHDGRTGSAPVDWDEGYVRANSVPQPPSPPASGREDMEVDGKAQGDAIEMYDVGNATRSIVPIAGGSGAAACVPVPGADVAIGPSFPGRRNHDQTSSMLPLSVPVPASDRLVFNGGSSRPRDIAYQPRPLLADQPSSVSDESLQPPVLSDTASVTIGDEDDTVERENKRPRVDSYEIALAEKDVPRTYAEAMAGQRYNTDEVQNCNLTADNALTFTIRFSLILAVVATIFFLATEAASMTPTSSEDTVTHSALPIHRVLRAASDPKESSCLGCKIQ
ncbi:hypothetical protein PsorP6_001947 [Peronosclerospora sorghi]|uniref:Uncharacterized protein n=1 Tax=Peronosclerospora sorghi TaxID=230839 RepID=A0ACC0WUC4_9STRA|nr:hypothetical protein PsorP6_001947 [Peronosclerospora sorghi]